MRFTVICSSTWDPDKILDLYSHLNWYHPNVVGGNLYITLWKLGELTELTAFANHSISLTGPNTDNDLIPTIEIIDE